MYAIFKRRRKKVVPLQFDSQTLHYNEECPICLSPLHTCVVLPCGHAYHDGCIQDHLEYQLTCPLCRVEIMFRCIHH